VTLHSQSEVHSFWLLYLGKLFTRTHEWHLILGNRFCVDSAATEKINGQKIYELSWVGKAWTSESQVMEIMSSYELNRPTVNALLLNTMLGQVTHWKQVEVAIVGDIECGCQSVSYMEPRQSTWENIHRCEALTSRYTGTRLHIVVWMTVNIWWPYLTPSSAASYTIIRKWTVEIFSPTSQALQADRIKLSIIVQVGLVQFQSYDAENVHNMAKENQASPVSVKQTS